MSLMTGYDLEHLSFYRVMEGKNDGTDNALKMNVAAAAKYLTNFLIQVFDHGSPCFAHHKGVLTCIKGNDIFQCDVIVNAL